MGRLNVVVTSAPKKLAELWIDHNLSWDLIDHVLAGDDVNNGKPDPEPYHKAAAAINADPSISFAVEDSINGIASAFGKIGAIVIVFAIQYLDMSVINYLGICSAVSILGVGSTMVTLKQYFPLAPTRQETLDREAAYVDSVREIDYV